MKTFLKFAKSSCKFKKQNNGFIKKYISQPNYNLMCSDVKSSHVFTKEKVIVVILGFIPIANLWAKNLNY